MESSVLSLQKLINKDQRSLNELQNHLEVDGWAFVELDSPTTSQISELAPQLLNFFNTTPSYAKFKHSENLVGGVETDGPVYGYNLDAPRKEGLRLLTNSRLSQRWIPDSCPGLTPFSETLHKLMFDLVSSASPHLFSCSAEELGKKWDVPMLRGEDHPKAKLDGPGNGRFAMLDVAYYFNSDSFELPNCEEHSDPGLLSLSVLSTLGGLQVFKRQTKEWVDAPTGVGNSTAILWGGTLIETITDGKLKSGIHRVLNSPNPTPRMSLWLECIAEFQDLALTAPRLKKQPATPPIDFTTFLTEQERSQLGEMVKISKLSGVSMSKRAPPPGVLEIGEKTDMDSDMAALEQSKLKELMELTKLTGVPMSKRAPPRQTYRLEGPPPGLTNNNIDNINSINNINSVNNTNAKNKTNAKNNTNSNKYTNRRRPSNNDNNMLNSMVSSSKRSGVPMSKKRPPPDLK
uniref:Fe2OG dioxygenase domain-containing protein n=1 Tax=Paramoeba aestuarina TaxID=180227 RepID=A0A7S4U8I6_9EUKA|mmetsp:Transcript_34555/g.53941  ORF Transcript_34555/g.53941 Transcript_34555/m.53941 type:complete len:460 (+) Transcript_34555:70-1449(+)|eukprot:CAMPEP_0201514420 /NCGR_PEP_ID=MMETSP0161_2-20130828/6269_1 /ASSEMBLY_ACC=CAM_ASM_000251 /TAXON_ID=180227 /ORGANISM="Neoparamoeba aestuarina, Strain SoJaBio B1-5/56/2" /LENGTH=459 /DNA_ID=CAMNT_0047910969 /DNA_START=59 /DNA_END=1438 /DNA_ORIENTATION=+